jgi:hypothetical protein
MVCKDHMDIGIGHPAYKIPLFMPAGKSSQYQLECTEAESGVICYIQRYTNENIDHRAMKEAKWKNHIELLLGRENGQKCAALRRTSRTNHLESIVRHLHVTGYKTRVH